MLRLSANAMNLFFDFLVQYDGFNNGDLCLAWSMMKKRGWTSRDTLAKARAELLAAGVIEVSRQGGRHKATLYALTIFSVNDRDGKLDIEATRAPKSYWHQNEGPLASPLVSPSQRKVVSRPAGQLATH